MGREVLLVVSGLSLIMSMLDIEPLPFDIMDSHRILWCTHCVRSNDWVD